MTRLSTEKRVMVLRCLVEGASVMAASRIIGVAKNTILGLVAYVGEACSVYGDEHVRGLASSAVQMDELWSFVGCKEKNRVESGQHGDAWVWTCICAETKVLVSFRVGDRSGRTAGEFCADLAPRFSGPVQITSDGLPTYQGAIGNAFDLEKTSFAQFVKVYEKNESGFDIVTDVKRQAVYGSPDMAKVSTSYVERSNLTMRMGNRRLTRLTNGFSKSIVQHCHMLALSFFHYNFLRVHMTLKQTPAQAAGLSAHRWSFEELVEMADNYHSEKVDAMFEAAFHAKFTPHRTNPKTYAPVKPKTPWYLVEFDNPEYGKTRLKPGPKKAKK